MSDTLFKQVNYNLGALMEYIEIGDIGLPDIQRPFVWNNAKVRNLFDSLYRGYPVGYLLFWQSGAENVTSRTLGTNTKQKVPKLLIVDGQQRMTALYAVVKGIAVVREDYSRERIQIAFRPSDQKFEVVDAAILKDPEYIPDISVIWSEGTDVFEVTDAYVERLRASRDVSDDELREARKAIGRLDSVLSFPFTVLELSMTVDEEQVAEVFVRINSTGTPLNQADFILTLMSVFWDDGRAELERFSRESRVPEIGGTSPYNQFITPSPDQLLRISVGVGFRRARLEYVYSILRGKDLETGQFSDERREEQFARLRQAQAYTVDLQLWHDFFKVVLLAGYRSGRMITSQNNLLYTEVLYLIGRKDLGVEPYVLKRAIARWFFMTSLTGRYTSSPETAMEADLARLRDVRDGAEFVAGLDRIRRDTLTDDYWNIRLPNDLATSASRSPSLFAYYAALNLLNARVLFSRNLVADLLDPATTAKRSAIERHHLFPKAYLNRIGLVDTRDTNQIANFALVEWDDNTSIADSAPFDYFPRYLDRFSASEIEDMRYWHALPDGWEDMEYREFLEARRKLIAHVIRDGYSRLLDAEEAATMALRAVS